MVNDEQNIKQHYTRLHDVHTKLHEDGFIRSKHLRVIRAHVHRGTRNLLVNELADVVSEAKPVFLMPLERTFCCIFEFGTLRV